VLLVFSAIGGFVFLTNQYVPSNIAVVVIDPGFGDRSMADQAYEGLYEVEVVVSYDFRVANDVDDLETIIDDIASNGDHDVIIVIGTEVGLAAAVDTVAAAYPNQRFGFIGGFVNQPNVASATFAYKEASFLAGALAAYLAVGNVNRTGIVGIIGSVNTDPAVAEYIDGFLQGLDYANQTLGNVILLPTQYVGSFNDSSTAEVLAKNMWNPTIGNASVIFAPVRASIIGIRSAMEYANLTWFCNTTNHEPFVIAAEGNQNYMGNPSIDIRSGPSWVVTSVVPRSDLAVYRIINATLWDDFHGASDYGGESASQFGGNLTNNGIGLADMIEFQNGFWVTGAMINMTIDYRLAIINGTILLDE
jgi:basic membrane lipoprotein Med (substrate-binding protein (PBP1-ABC) superfamily)